MPKFAQNCPLTSKQEAAVLVLLKPFHGTNKQVAEAVGVSERTIKYWLKQPRFQERLKEGRAQVWQEALDNLTGTLSWASRVLAELLQSGSESVRLRAALGIVAASIKARETFEIEERISALEAESLRRKNKGGI